MRVVLFAIVFVLVVSLAVLALALPWWVAAAVALVTFTIVALYFGIRHLVARRASGSLERALFKQAGDVGARVRPDQRAEIATLSREFQEAVATLKTSKLGRGRAGALYALPWYVIIGPPGAGKSTALRNSGLTFPRLGGRQASIRGIGGTRNCEWWLTNEAVILDTAGRYTTDDEDRDEWLAFLDMLRRHRSSRPVNGVLVAISIAEVGLASDDALDVLAARVRERLDEVVGRLGVLVPVYVLFTKCDLLPGFVETFGDPSAHGAQSGLRLHAPGVRARRRSRRVPCPLRPPGVERRGSRGRARGRGAARRRA